MSTDLIELGDVVKVDRTTATDNACRMLPFVGLEHIEKDTGSFVSEYRRVPKNLLATKFRFTPQHVLYGKLRPNLNKVLYPRFDGVCTTEILPLIPKNGAIDTPYLYFLLQSHRFVSWATHSVSGANLPRLDPKTLEEFSFRLPPVRDQRMLAGTLLRAQALRRMHRYALQMCGQLLPSLFLEMFGDPASNPRSYPIVFAEELFDETRGGAKCGPFGSALKNSEYVNSGIPVWTMENVQSNHFTDDARLYITDKKYEQLKAYAVTDGDILISRAGTVGRMAIVRTRHDRSIMHSNLIRLSLNRALVTPEYFVVLMTWFGSRIAKLKTGQEDAYTFMNTGTLGELPIPLPSADEQKRFLSLVHRHHRLCATHVEALRQADHLFQTLLRQAFVDR